MGVKCLDNIRRKKGFRMWYVVIGRCKHFRMDALKAFTVVAQKAIKIFAEKNPDFPMDLSFYCEELTITTQE